MLQNKVLSYTAIVNTIWGQEEKAKLAQLPAPEKRVAFRERDGKEGNITKRRLGPSRQLKLKLFPHCKIPQGTGNFSTKVCKKDDRDPTGRSAIFPVSKSEAVTCLMAVHRQEICCISPAGLLPCPLSWQPHMHWHSKQPQLIKNHQQISHLKTFLIQRFVSVGICTFKKIIIILLKQSVSESGCWWLSLGLRLARWHCSYEARAQYKTQFSFVFPQHTCPRLKKTPQHLKPHVIFKIH